MWSKRSLWKRCSEINVSRHWSTWAYMGTTQRSPFRTRTKPWKSLATIFIGLVSEPYHHYFSREFLNLPKGITILCLKWWLTSSANTQWQINCNGTFPDACPSTSFPTSMLKNEDNKFAWFSPIPPCTLFKAMPPQRRTEKIWTHGTPWNVVLIQIQFNRIHSCNDLRARHCQPVVP